MLPFFNGDRYTKPVASMAVLGDDDPNWLPQEYACEALDCEVGFRFPVAKLARYAGQEAALEADPNPFALLTLAYLHTRATRGDMPRRFDVKCKLVRLLYARKWDRMLIIQFFLVIDWMMALPPELESKLTDFIGALEDEREMEYVSSVERVKLAQVAALNRQEGLLEGKQEGLHEGQAELLTRLLSRRFGNLPLSLQERIKNASKEQIQAWFDCGIEAKSLDEVFQDLPH